MTIGQSIKALRAERKWTQGKLAMKCGISQSLMSQYETDRAVPSLYNAITIADVLGVTLDNLVGRKI